MPGMFLLDSHTRVARCRVVLLSKLGLGLLDQLLLLLVLVLIVLGFLGRGNGSLMGETIEDTQAKGGPPQNL